MAYAAGVTEREAKAAAGWSAGAEAETKVGGAGGQGAPLEGEADVKDKAEREAREEVGREEAQEGLGAAHQEVRLAAPTED